MVDDPAREHCVSFNNAGHDEDTMAFCGTRYAHGWNIGAGLHDWGKSQKYDTYENMASKFPLSVNPAPAPARNGGR